MFWNKKEKNLTDIKEATDSTVKLMLEARANERICTKCGHLKRAVKKNETQEKCKHDYQDVFYWWKEAMKK